MPSLPISTGRSQSNIPSLQEAWGKNEIPHKKPPSDLEFAFNQFKNPLVVVLLVAMAITALLREFTDTAVIGLAVGINTILGFLQERKAYKTLESLKNVLSPNAWVIRDGNKSQIEASELVPGDIVVLHQGDKVPADGVVLKSIDCWINEAIITGESAPVEKHTFTDLPDEVDTLDEAAEYLRQQTELAEQVQVWMGTIVSTGTAHMIVTKTGANTALGKISQDVQTGQEEPTPLEKRLGVLSRWLTIIIMGLAVVVFALGMSTGRDWLQMLKTTVALAVAAIPEGLIVALTAILALGMYRILKRQAVVRRLMATETLGSVTTVCLDKTGTLTEGQLRVVDTNFSDPVLAHKAAILANDRRDPLDIGRWNWAQERAEKEGKRFVDPNQLLEDCKDDIQLLPFSLERRLVAAQCQQEVFVVGAPEDVLNWCDASPKEQEAALTTVQEWAEQGRRVIAFAGKKLSSQSAARKVFDHLKDNRSPQSELEWIGLMAFVDPIRAGIKDALQAAQAAGIRPIVITGDYAPTARAVMRQLDIEVNDQQTITGQELHDMSDAELAQTVQSARLFARIKPEQKLRIVHSLQANKEIVAMMGDGVNDAPAISAADIGLAVDTATEVSQEAADVVLLNADFSTILAAIEEGRAIFLNLRKIVLYLLSDTFTEVLLILGSLLLGWPLPLTAAQILWINVIKDGLPGLALTLEPKDEGLLKRPPISPQSRIVNGEISLLIALVSGTTGTLLLMLFGWLQPQVGTMAAQSVVFTGLSFASFLYLFSCRSPEKPIWENMPWRNPWVIGSVVASAVLTLFALYVPVLQRILELQPIRAVDWMLVATVSVVTLILIETVKYIWLAIRGHRR